MGYLVIVEKKVIDISIYKKCVLFIRNIDRIFIKIILNIFNYFFMSFLSIYDFIVFIFIISK